MATLESPQLQATSEIKTYTVDFTDELPSGGTVTAGTATHIPPSGAVSTVTVTVSNPYLYATLPAQSVVGSHYLDILATFNDGQKSAVRLPINVVYPSTPARSGMVDLLSDLRAMTDTGPDEYSVAGVPYWSDAQLQRILDRHRTELKWVEMEAQEEGDGSFLEYVIGAGNIEQTTGGTAIFFVQDVNGSTISSSLYTVDYVRGVVTFASDTAGTSYFATGRSYDLNGASAEVWRMKQSHYAGAVDFSTKVHNISRSQLFEHAKEMCEYFSALGNAGFGTMDVMRSDTDEL
jgi:hypothetical protein